MFQVKKGRSEFWEGGLRPEKKDWNFQCHFDFQVSSNLYMKGGCWKTQMIPSYFPYFNVK